MKVYISGPITGIPDLNRHAFEQAKKVLRSHGLIPISPIDVCAEASASWTWADYMREDITAMMGCEAITMLPGWKQSRGAKIEHDLAMALGFTIIRLS